MPISIQTLEQASIRQATSVAVESYVLAKANRRKTAFLSHSHLDAKLAKGLQVLLAEQGWLVFIDWEHISLDGRPTKEACQTIQRAIQECDWLLYLATPNSQKSKWCPWEIGYADGKKGSSAILIISTTDSNGAYGSEYLSLYRQISETTTGGYAIYEAGNATTGKYLREARTSPASIL